MKKKKIEPLERKSKNITNKTKSMYPIVMFT